jgi:lipocalin
MKRIILTLAIVMTAISCNAQRSIDRTTVASLDVERYMGRWYEIARYDHSFERNMEYCKAQYTLMPDGKILVENSGVDSRNGKYRVADGKAKIGEYPGQLRVSFFLFFYSDYNILALDSNYEWALVGSKSPKYLWILSRTQKLPDAVLNKILATAQEKGYDTSNLIMVAQ